MKTHQLSVFLENKPGQLSLPCRLLGNAGINILSLSLADTQQFGILRLIVKDWERAKAVLEKAGCVVKVSEVVALDVDDQPGGLAKVLEALEEAKINIEYMYVYGRKRVLLLFRFEDPDAALKVLEKHKFKIVPSAEMLAKP